MSEHLKWKILSKETVKKDRWVDLSAGRYLLPNGMELKPFYTTHNRDFAVIVPRNEAGEYLCVRQFRPGVSDVTTEFPAGAIEEGETPLDAAKRELLEETGFVSDHWTFLCRISPNATIADNSAWCFAADQCRRISDQHLDASECVDEKTIPAEELAEMVRTNHFIQAVHIAAYYMAERRFSASPS